MSAWAVEDQDLDLEADRPIAVENTPQVHNVIVCSLCSCYPRALLGVPPTWYKSENYRRRVVRVPRAVLREFGTIIPDDVVIRACFASVLQLRRRVDSGLRSQQHGDETQASTMLVRHRCTVI